MRALTALLPALALAFGLIAGAGQATAAGGDPEPTIAELKQARAAIDNKDYQSALPLLQTALAVAPDNADVWNLMGFAHRKLGQTDKALAYYQKALAINRDHRGALEYLGELYLETGRAADAKKMLARLDDVCFFGCREYDDLKKALKAAKVID